MKKFIVFFSFVALGCTSTQCLNQKSVSTQSSETSPPMAIERVRVYKPDGSLQCGQGSTESLDETQKLLQNIKVFKSFNKNDGQMRIQLCGSPTGNSNVYEITKTDLDAALKLGFKHWVFE